jgi:hydroxymethylglutaryl-CoA reductase
MRLHAKNIAMAVGAKGELVDILAQRMVEEGEVNFQKAKQLLDELRCKT